MLCPTISIYFEYSKEINFKAIVKINIFIYGLIALNGLDKVNWCRVNAHALPFIE
jgi:hypothetical protein